MKHDCDLAVIGGGIHGAGVAQAAAAGGLRVTVLEQYPSLAQGSSSRSSKLIHGGLRYLETAQFSLVRESLRERALLLRLAPELVTLQPFHIPIYRDSRRPRWMLRAGLSLYAALGGFGTENRFTSLGADEWPTLDGLSLEGLRAVYRYHDAQTDDAALTRAVMASAVELGARLQMSARVNSLTIENDGLKLGYTQDDEAKELRAAAVVNAGGPWVNRVLECADPQQPLLSIDLVQGAHLVLPGRLEQGIYYVEAADGRVIFAMPWRGNIMVGTTETPWRDEPAASYPRDEEIDYLLTSFGHLFPALKRERREIVAAFAGLRVLPASEGDAFSRPRDVVLHAPGGRNARLLSIYGGKLTTYRATAAKVLERLKTVLPEARSRADTREIPLRPVD
jgi:glycerol-3-phosphate dehydrogenase